MRNIITITRGGRMKVVLVSRHKLLPSQEKAIKELKWQIVEQVQQLPEDPKELSKLVQRWKERGVQGVLTVALPPHILATLSKLIDIYVFKMKAYTLPESEAKKLVEEKPEYRVTLPPPPGKGELWRVVEFVGISKVKVVIEEEEVYRSD